MFISQQYEHISLSLAAPGEHNESHIGTLPETNSTRQYENGPNFGRYHLPTIIFEGISRAVSFKEGITVI